MRRVLVLLAAALLAGCGSGDGDDEAAGDTTGVVGEVELTATEFKFDPSMVELAKTGEMTFTLVNDGQLTHALEIEGQGIEEESDEIDGGATTDLTVDLEAGEYEFYCPVGNHREQGMEGTIVVGSGAGGGGMTTQGTDTEESGGSRRLRRLGSRRAAARTRPRDRDRQAPHRAGECDHGCARDTGRPHDADRGRGRSDRRHRRGAARRAALRRCAPDQRQRRADGARVGA